MDRLRKITAVAVFAGQLLACGGGGGGAQIGPPVVVTVQVSPQSPVLTVGDTLQMSAVALDSAGNSIPGRTVIWASDDDSKATVTATGLVSGVAAGTTRVTATISGRLGASSVTVVAPVQTPAAVASVTVEPASATIVEGGSHQFTAVARDAQGKVLIGRGMQWLAQEPQIAHIDGGGRVTAVRAGATTVTVRVEGASAVAGVRVAADYPFDLIYDRRADDGTTSLYTLDISDSAALASPVAVRSAIVSNPAASPDGRKIAYVVQLPVDTVIEVANRDGSNPRQLTLAGSSADQPAWSPDATRIAYRRRTPGAGADIWVMAASDGGDAVNLTASHGVSNQSSPAWSPLQGDGSYRIAYTHSHAGVGEIWSMRADGTDHQQITSLATAYDDYPSWSPDGSRLAFVRTGDGVFADLYVVDARGGRGSLLMQLAGPLAGTQLAPAWSPDGRMLAFASRHTGDRYQIFTVWSDGTRLAQRTSDMEDHDNPSWLVRVATIAHGSL